MINEEKVLSIDFFNLLLRLSPVPKGTDLTILYIAYSNAIKSINKISEQNKDVDSALINPLTIFKYSVDEFLYSSLGFNAEQTANLKKNEAYILSLTTVIVDKYLSLEHFSFQTSSVYTRYFPPLSSMDLYVNYVLKATNKYRKAHPPETLISDMMLKFFSMCHCIVFLLSSGFETEALSTWRTLHETECNILILNKHPEAIPVYLKHITYNLAFRGTIADKEKSDKIFEELKSKMKERDYKSKDMKRYIENGWIFSVKEIAEDPNVKLNFRNGIEYSAGLEDMNAWYEMSSEIAHSSPLLIYSNKIFFFDMTLVALYGSFIRIEEVFYKEYKKIASEEEYKAFTAMRNIRLKEISKINEIEKEKLNAEAESVGFDENEQEDE